MSHSAEMMEERGATKGNAQKPPTPRTQSRTSRVSMGLEGVRIAARSDRALRFTSLLHHITPELLTKSFYALKRDAAAGVDGITWTDYEKQIHSRVAELHREIQGGSYRAKPSRRVYIPKADGRQRPLGIASVEDKVVQQAVATVLNQIYEADFLGFSYGFRVGRSQHNALDAVTTGIKTQPVNWILDADVQSFFDEIDHDWMMKFLNHRVADDRLLRLIRKWLKAGVVEDGRRIPGFKGSPQGSVISPLLANVYLHYVFDQWAHQWRKRHAHGCVLIVRYADDSILGFEVEEDAQKFLRDMEERFAKFGLTLNPSKTRLIEFGRNAHDARRAKGLGRSETFDFLGFTHCCGKDRKGKFQIVRRTARKRIRSFLAAVSAALRQRMHHRMHDVGIWLGQVMAGYLNYHAIPGGNIFRLNSVRLAVCRLWRQTLRRRGQRHRLQWHRLGPYMNRYIAKARVLHPWPEARFHASHPG